VGFFDGAGKVWVAKLGKEAQPETASSRLVWAVGYTTEINYLVPCVHIQGAPEPRYKVPRCEGDGFANVKLEARPKGVKRLETWSWNKNAFSGTKEFQGMVVLMSLLNNWDLKDDNNKIVYVPASLNGVPELRYIISDLGATFGKTGGVFSRNRNSVESFASSKFVEGVQGGNVRFAYGGKNTGLFKNITLEQTKWIGSWLSRLTDQQISDAFRAANYSPEEVETLVTKPIEDAVAGINGVKRVQSSSTESRAMVGVELRLEVDAQNAAAEVRATVRRWGGNGDDCHRCDDRRHDSARDPAHSTSHPETLPAVAPSPTHGVGATDR